MGIQGVDINTLIIAGAIGLVGWGLRGVAGALIESIKQLITHLIQTVAKVQLLENKLTELIQAVGDVQKIRYDLNNYYDRLKKLEDKYQNGHL